jgi:hypothetical protein
VSAYDDYRKEIEDEILPKVNCWRPVQRDIVYLLLYNLGHRIDGIDYRIEQAARAELKAQGK